MTKEIQITPAQSRMIGELNTAAMTAADRLTLTITAILAGHGLEGAKVKAVDTNKHTLTVETDD